MPAQAKQCPLVKGAAKGHLIAAMNPGPTAVAFCRPRSFWMSRMTTEALSTDAQSHLWAWNLTLNADCDARLLLKRVEES
jgi:hypothetical protein